ncbi:MAG: ABC transporter permease [Ruminococcus sp.]|nr:ABC transporter permease [Ruminococcus sp.]
MNRLLGKRIPRDFLSNIGRYIALIFLIAMGIFIVVSMVGAADTFIIRTEDNKSINHVEDGNFTVFMPLEDSEIEKISSDGTLIEEVFYSDIKAEDGSILRMMKNRSEINLIQLDDGRLAETSDEAVIEKRYAEVHNLKTGDKITVAGVTFTITGIGTAPDYEMPIKTYSDAVVESNNFGLIFVTDEIYQSLVSSKNADVQAEEYVYAFRLGENTSPEDLRKEIEELDFDYKKVENQYFKESIDNILKDRYDIEDSMNEFSDGVGEFQNGIDELDSNSNELLDATDELFNSYLEFMEQSLNEQGVFLGLTRENYTQKIDELINDINSGKINGIDDTAETIEQLEEIQSSLDSLIEFSDGINDYTDGVNECASGADKLATGTEELNDGINELLDEVFQLDLYNLTSFVKADDNVRIGAAAEDVSINKAGGLLAGIIMLILFTYVISVFVMNQIEQESGIIGAMYALGVRKKNLMTHYITLPVIITLIGGIIGTVAGFSEFGARNMMDDTYNYFSVPEMSVVHPLYLIIYGVLLPPVICVIVNVIVINGKLSKTALSLMKNEQKAGDFKQFKISSDNFIHCFRIRQIVRELRSVLTVVCGILISVILVELGLDIFVMCDAVKVNNVADTNYSYQYLYKYPDEEVPEGGEGAYLETLQIDNAGTMLDVTIIGLEKESKYFNAVLPEGKNKAAINNSIYERYNLKDGETLILKDSTTDTSYVFTVNGRVQYSPGFTIFMDIDSMRELFERDDDYFNTVYSDKELDIDTGRLYSVTTKENIKSAAGVFIDNMMSMIVMMISASIIVFCVVMYLMMNVMIDKSKFGISLIKIFGFRNSEIRKLYLDSNFIVVAVGTLICIPLGKKLVDMIYPMLITNIASCMKLEYPFYFYVIIYVAVLIVYLIINKILMIKINKITPAEVLKERD